MGQASEQECFAFECRGRFEKFSRVETALAHLFDGERSIAELCIGSFIDGAKTSFADLTHDAIALFEYVLLNQQAGEGVADGAGGFVQGASAGGAKHRSRPIGRATSIAKEG